MRIDPRFAATTTAAAAQASRPAGSTKFSLGATSSREAARANAAAPLATLDAILMLQEEDPRERRRRQAKRGQDLLEGLDKLKAGLLTGTIPAHDLEALSRQLAANAGGTGDPGLDEALSAIELRVRVELAKLGRS